MNATQCAAALVLLSVCAGASGYPIPGDANDDGIIGIGDFAVLSMNFGRTDANGPEEGDFDGDGVVGLSDLGIQATNYGGWEAPSLMWDGYLISSSYGLVISQGATVGDGLTAYQLAMVNRDPADSRYWPWGWHSQMFGPMNQRQVWFGSWQPTPDWQSASQLPPEQQAQDTHFLAQLSALYAFEEDDEFGGLLTVTNSSGYAGPRVPVMQFVVPEGERVQFKALVADGTGAAYFVECMLPFVIGDADHDDSVTLSDLGILASHWGTTDPTNWEVADFNDDGLVDLSDLGMLAANWGGGEESIPEPATLTLLGLAAAGMLQRPR